MDLVSLLEHNLIQPFIPERTLTLMSVSKRARAAMCKYELRVSAAEIVQSVRFTKLALGLKISEENIYHYAIGSGNLSILKYLRRRGKIIFSDLIAKAAGCGHLHVVKWGFRQRMPLTVRACIVAAERNHIHVLKWLRLKQCPWDARVMVSVVCAGDINTVKWLLEKKCPWNTGAYVIAAAKGHHDIIKLAWKHNKNMPGMLARVAYGSGHLELAKWLYYRCGQDIGSDFHEYAFRCGDYKMIQWALNQGIQFPVDLPEFAAQVLGASDFEWILSVHPSINAHNVYLKLIKRGDMDLLRIARNAGLPWSAELSVLVLPWQDGALGAYGLA